MLACRQIGGGGGDVAADFPSMLAARQQRSAHGRSKTSASSRSPVASVTAPAAAALTTPSPATKRKGNHDDDDDDVQDHGEANGNGGDSSDHDDNERDAPSRTKKRPSRSSTSSGSVGGGVTTSEASVTSGVVGLSNALELDDEKFLLVHFSGLLCFSELRWPEYCIFLNVRVCV